MSKCFLVQVLIIIGAGLATGLAFSMNSKVQLHLPKDINAQFANRAAKPTPPPTVPPTVPPAVPPAATGPTGPTTPTGSTQPPTTPAPADVFITVDAAKALFDSRAAVFIDARPKPEYLKSHIRGAMHLEKTDLEGAIPAKIDFLIGQEVVVYCHGELCTDSENVVKRLAAFNKGIGPFRIIKEGFPGWEKAKYPVDTGPEVGF